MAFLPLLAIGAADIRNTIECTILDFILSPRHRGKDGGHESDTKGWVHVLRYRSNCLRLRGSDEDEVTRV